MIPEPCKSGEVLYGNDFTPDEMTAWFEDEKRGYIDIYQSYKVSGYQYHALNHSLGTPLRDRRYETCLVLGCAEGTDVLALDLDIGRIIAIEPAEEWHRDSLAGIPASFRVPALDGTIDLPDASVDLCLAIGVLHHIPNVEHLVAEMGRVLKPGGRMLVREPINSMGDWTIPRAGHTKNERGIPPALMARFMGRAGLKLDRTSYHYCIVPQLATKLGREPYNSRLFTTLDRLLSEALAWNARYWRPRKIDKLAPAMAAWWATKA
jgi:SAM-dependent methyltransferase